MEQGVSFDLNLIRRYDQSGPRYTSYPTAVEFSPEFTQASYEAACARSNDSGRNLSLYFHLPFCKHLCFYCACNKIVTGKRDRLFPYLDALDREIEMQSRYFDAGRKVTQLHWGGGTPTFLNTTEMTRVMETTRKYFSLVDEEDGQFSIEIDPREVSEETVAHLRKLGFNRMSMGVQDFDIRVQKAINRVQSETETMGVLEAARKYGFRSVSMDLIYGLPLQSADSFMHTLDRVIEVDPDRISVFNYAHLPQIFKLQRHIKDEDLPNADTKLAILQMTIQRLNEAGYVFIGMDHFAKPDDELTRAQRAGNLYRNFQGYSTHADCDLVGMGITSIGKIDNTYSQNRRTLDEYYAAIYRGELAVFRGITLNQDDLIRRDVITQLICNFKLDFSSVEDRWGLDFSEYFADSLDRLEPMQDDGLVMLDDHMIVVNPRGRLLIRNICMAFDAYLAAKSGPVGFSKVI